MLYQGRKGSHLEQLAERGEERIAETNACPAGSTACMGGKEPGVRRTFLGGVPERKQSWKTTLFRGRHEKDRDREPC